jgi:GTP-binding protein Era
MASDTPTPPGFRAGFCAIVGRPNVGKSTLLNRILGQKLAAVTPKPQTTRNRIIGVKNRPGAQTVFVDTPGIHRARSELNQFMVKEALGAAADADVVLLVVEAPRIAPEKAAGHDVGEGVKAILAELAALTVPRVLAVNKVDLVADKAAILPVIDEYRKALAWDDIVPIVATSGDGVEALEAAIAGHLPESEPLFPEEMLTDRAERFLAAELIREQAFLLLEEELPYSLAVTIESWKERPDKKDVVVDATLHVERDSQKRIVVGEGGRMIRELGTRARAEIGRMLDCPVHLKLFVKVDPEWTRQQAALRRLGYEPTT